MITHEIRAENKKGKRTVKTTPLKAIALHCIECFAFQKSMVKDCSAPLCPLYPYRLGRDCSKRGGKGLSPEKMRKLREKIRRTSSKQDEKKG